MQMERGGGCGCGDVGNIQAARASRQEEVDDVFIFLSFFIILYHFFSSFRWTVADRHKNLQLCKEEFAAFIHPEHSEHMGDILISETMADFDQDGDGKLDLAE